MADDFNPYYVWLGIPPDEQPANFYRLLGIRLFESSADVIDSAADRQTAHLRTFQGGKHGELTQRILNEVAAARVCLLDAARRAKYDQQLRAQLASSPQATAQSEAQPGTLPAAQSAAPPAAMLRRPTAQGGVDASGSAGGDKWDDLLGATSAKPKPVAATKLTKSLKAAAARREANSRMIAIGAAVGLALIGAIGFGVYSQTSSADATLVFDWPGVERAELAVMVDDVPIAVPVTGPWEHRCPAGPHRIVAQRPAFKLNETVTAEAGQRQSVPADWRPKAVLVLHWRPADRTGATLRVDNQPRPISQNEPLELPVEPGRHLVQITRPGAAPFAMTTVVAADERELVNVPRPPAEAKLVLDWPADQRKDAELTIDGISRNAPAGSAAKPLELTLDPGPHILRISRPGFEAFTMDINLASGINHPIKPVWTPQPGAAQPELPTTPVPTETVTHPAKKYPVPPAAEQERIAKQLDEIYQTAKAGPDDAAKAQHLYDVAVKPGSAPAERYMLFIKGAEKAVAGGDVMLAMQGIDQLALDFEVDPLEMKEKLLEKFVSVGKPDQVAKAIPVAEQLMDQAEAADEFEIAIVLATTAGKAAAKGQIATRKETEDRLALRRHNLRMMMPMYAAATKAEELLAKDPADPEANLKAGRWRCLFKNDWAGGVPLLAKGSDEKLKVVAEQELKAPTDAEKQVELADAWWELSRNEGGTSRDSLRAHAADIYRTALPNLASALKKAGIEKRLAEITTAPHPVNPVKPPPKPLISGTFTLITQYNGLYLAVSGGGTNQGTPAAAEPNPNDDKFWNLEPQPGGSIKITNKRAGLVLGIRQDQKDLGVDAILWGWGGSDGQQWLLEPLKNGLVRIRNRNSGLCLSVRTSDSRGIVQEPWSNLPNQQWKLIPASP